MKKNILAFAVLAAISAPAMAASSNMYVAVDIGQSKAADACTGTPVGITCTDTATGFRIAGGYQFTPMWSVEVSYTDLGKSKIDDPSGIIAGTPLSGGWKASALQISGIGTFAVNDAFSGLVKLGLVDSTTKLDVSVPGLGSGGTSATKANLGFGFGAQYNFNKQVGIRAQYEDLGTFGDSASTGTSKVQFISAGLVCNF